MISTYPPATRTSHVPDITSLELLGQVIGELRFRLLYIREKPTAQKLRKMLAEFALEHNLGGGSDV